LDASSPLEIVSNAESGGTAQGFLLIAAGFHKLGETVPLMTGKRLFCAATLFVLSLTTLPALGQNSQALPDAPDPNPGLPPVHASGSDTYAPSKWYGVVDPGEKVPPLHPHDKMVFWLHEDARPVGWIPAIIASGWSQWVGGDPKYGSDSPAFGERIGAAVLRDTSMRFFSDSLLPTVTHEDPRYFRKAYGGIKGRAAYALEQVFVCRRDDGSSGFNYSNTMGHLAGSALTPTYYPARSANGQVVATTWALSLAGDAAGNLFLEFWPDVRDAVFLRQKRHKP
jgi:hypothetical protein